MRAVIFILVMANFALAGPTTRRSDVAPKDPPVVSYIGQAFDAGRPVDMPVFLDRPGKSQLQTERDWATTHTVPSFSLPQPWGCGNGWRANHGFYR